jgi:multiple sugar transport system substrate-binding protein
MRKTTRTLVAIGAITAVASMSACSSGGGTTGTGDADFGTDVTGTLDAWGFENADDVGTSRLDYAAAQLDGLEVTIDQTAFDAQKFTTRVAGGNVPDVVQMDRRFVATYAAQGLIMPLDECFSAHDVDPTATYYEAVLADVTYDDGVWGVPQFYQPPAIILNNRVLDAAGVSPEEIDTSQPDVLLAAIEKMYEEEGGNPSVLGFDPVAGGQAGLWILGSGGQLIADGKPTIDDESNVAGLELLKRITDAQGGYAKIKSFSDAFDSFGENNQFVADQVGAQVNAQWYVNVLSPYVDDLDISAVPFRGVDGEPFAVAGGQAFVIPANAKNPDAACAWALELTSQAAWEAAGEARAATLEETPGAINSGLFTGSPAADDAVREQYVGDSGNPGFDQTISTYYDAVQSGQTFGASPAGQQIEAELNNAVQSVLLGDKAPEEALADAQEAAMRAYDQAVG